MTKATQADSPHTTPALSIVYARQTFIDMLQTLHEEEIDIIRHQGLYGPLFVDATSNDDLELAELLLDKKLVDINRRYIGNGNYTALTCAVKNGCQTGVAFLLEKGADIECKDKYGGTPIMVAAIINRFAIAQLLLEKGANILAINDAGTTASDIISDKPKQKQLYDFLQWAEDTVISAALEAVRKNGIRQYIVDNNITEFDPAIDEISQLEAQREFNIVKHILLLKEEAYRPLYRNYHKHNFFFLSCLDAIKAGDSEYLRAMIYMNFVSLNERDGDGNNILDHASLALMKHNTSPIYQELFASTLTSPDISIEHVTNTLNKFKHTLGNKTENEKIDESLKTTHEEKSHEATKKKKKKKPKKTQDGPTTVIKTLEAANKTLLEEIKEDIARILFELEANRDTTQKRDLDHVTQLLQQAITLTNKVDNPHEITTSTAWNLLDYATRFGTVSDMQSLLAKGWPIHPNSKIISAAIMANDSEKLTILLQQNQMTMPMLLHGLETAIQTNQDALIQNIATSQKIVDAFEILKPQQRKECVNRLNKMANRNPHIHTVLTTIETMDHQNNMKANTPPPPPPSEPTNTSSSSEFECKSKSDLSADAPVFVPAIPPTAQTTQDNDAQDLDVLLREIDQVRGVSPLSSGQQTTNNGR